MDNQIRLCSIDGCSTQWHCRDWCQKHYFRWRAHGDPLINKYDRFPKTCMIQDCNQTTRARGFCNIHYQQKRKSGEFTPNKQHYLTDEERQQRTEQKTRKKVERELAKMKNQPCEIEGCLNLSRTRFLCKIHYSNLYEKEHPGFQANTAAKRRALKRNAFVEYVDREVVFEFFNGQCYMCWKILDPDDWHLEHVIPLSKDGEHSYANTAAACPPCNQRKFNKIL